MSFTAKTELVTAVEGSRVLHPNTRPPSNTLSIFNYPIDVNIHIEKIFLLHR